MLDTAGLAATIQEHLDQWARQTGAEYTLANRLNGEPGTLTRTTLYRIAVEALANVRKHARATHVGVELDDDGAGYLLQVVDNGIGIAPRPDGDPADHFGVSMMAERAAMAGGWCRVESNDAGPGTTVVAWAPEAEVSRDGTEGCDAADTRADR
jgi:signal transduction histidine kinase